MTDTATIKVYEGYHDSVPKEEPIFEYEAEICSDWWGKSYPTSPAIEADTVLFADEIEFHSNPISLYCETDRPVMLCVHTCDRYHDPNDWGKPIEQGLNFNEGSEVPFGCEVWGRVLMWVAEDG